MPKQQFLDEARKALGFEPPKQSLRRAIAAGVVKPDRFGRYYSFDADDLTAYCKWIRERSYIGRRMAATA